MEVEAADVAMEAREQQTRAEAAEADLRMEAAAASAASPEPAAAPVVVLKAREQIVAAEEPGANILFMTVCTSGVTVHKLFDNLSSEGNSHLLMYESHR